MALKTDYSFKVVNAPNSDNITALLAYVKKQDLQKYRDLIKTLGIRG